MADVVDKATRSRMMAGIQGKDTKPELRVRRFLHGCGLRFRLHVGALPGKPDLIFPQYKTVVFVHGCFWHQHPKCRFAYMPASNRKFWMDKLAATVRRDQRTTQELRRAGWRVLTAWECQLSDRRLDALARRVSGKAK